MKIIYNPKNGADVKGMIIEGRLMEPHLIDTLKQYEDNDAEIMINHYGFLEEKTPQEAQEILNKPKDAAFKCNYCDFVTDTKIALMGHSRKHKDEIEKAKEPTVDPDIIPIAGVEQVVSPKELDRGLGEEELPDGTDKDGVSWYGGGLKVEEKN